MSKLATEHDISLQLVRKKFEIIWVCPVHYGIGCTGTGFGNLPGLNTATYKYHFGFDDHVRSMYECKRQNQNVFTFFKNSWNSNFRYHVWIQHNKCIQMSTNKPSIGSVVLEIAHVMLSNEYKQA